MKHVGDYIKQARVHLGLSQAEAAAKLKISTPAFCKIEKGQTDLNISRLFQISKTFEVPVATLLGLERMPETTDSSAELIELKEQLQEKDEEINKLRKKVIDLYDKLGI